MVTICDVYFLEEHKLVYVYSYDGWTSIYSEDFIRGDDEPDDFDSICIASVNFFDEDDCDDERFNTLLHECYDIHQQYIASENSKSEENDTIEYDEEQQLKLLAESINSALEAENDKFEQTVDDDSDFDQGYFSIIIADRIHRFMIGGPQIEALYKFIQHICGENWYPDIV